MGIVAKQSARNAVVLSTGLVLGAVNTMYVLPKAFEGFEEGWGLLRILTAWGTILAQIVALGSPSGIMRFLPKADSADREASMLSTLVLFPTAFLLLKGGFGAEPDLSLRIIKNVGPFLPSMGQRFVDLAQQGTLGLWVVSKLSGQAFLLNQPCNDGFTVPSLEPVIVVEVLGHTAPKTLVRRCLRAFLLFALPI